MRRLHSTAPRLLFPARTFSVGRSCLAQRSTQNLDTTGRAPGFARRQRSQRQSPAPSSIPQEPQKQDKVSLALEQTAQDDKNGLHSPVHVPEDANGVLRSDHPATSILANSSIIIQRQLEMMNVMMGFEQANKYVIMDPNGSHIGYLAEQEHGLGNAMARQAFRTHRSFTTHVFDKNEREVLRFHRPFSWISSRIRVYDAFDLSSFSYSSSNALDGTSAGSVVSQSSAQVSGRSLSDMRVIGEAQQQWAPLRRKYNLFLLRELLGRDAEPNAPQLTAGDLPLSNSTALEVSDPSKADLGFAQFASVDEPFLSWDFSLLSEDRQLIGSVNRNFAGFAREIFTDTGVYALRMDAAGLIAEPQHLISQSGQTPSAYDNQSTTGMTLDQRAIMLATAVSIDFDYFSRHSHAGGGWMPLWFPWGGGAAAGEAGGAEAGSVGAAGAAGAAGASAEAGGMEAGAAGAGAAAQGTANEVGTLGSRESAVAGAGSLAGYDALQRSRESRVDDSQSPQSPQAPAQPVEQQQQQMDQDDDFWNGWGGGDGGSTGGGGGGGGGGGDGGDFFSDLF